MKYSKFFLPAVLFVFLFIAGCDSDVMEDEEVMTTLRLQPVFSGQPLLMDQTYDHNGTAISFDGARIYLSEITLIAEDGTETLIEGPSITVPAKDENDADVSHTVSNRVILAKHDHGQEEYDLGMAMSGSYTGMRFKVGIDGQDNRVDASQVPSNHALAKQTDKNNHWNWANGYIYLRVDGLADSDGDGTPDAAFETHLGKTTFLREVELNTAFELTEGITNQIHVMLDYAHLLHMVDLSDPLQLLCHTGDNIPVAQKVAGQISGAFMLHGLHESEHSHHD